MNKKLIIGLLTVFMVAPNISSAEDFYGVITYGTLDSDGEDMGNMGFTLGNNISDSLSFEASYGFTVSEADLGSGDNLTTTTIGLFAVYQSVGDTYFKGKFGYSKIDFDLEVFGITFTDDTSGLSYGVGFGLKTGNGALEFEYTILPDLDSFQGIPGNVSNDYFGIGYKFNF